MDRKEGQSIHFAVSSSVYPLLFYDICIDNHVTPAVSIVPAKLLHSAAKLSHPKKTMAL